MIGNNLFIIIFLKNQVNPLRKILHKLGVPKRIIDLIHSFHQGMSAKITIDLDASRSEQIDVNNDLR